VRFHVVMTASMKMTGLWDLAPCSIMEIGRHFKSAYCLHHQVDNSSHRSASTRLHDAISPKAAIFRTGGISPRVKWIVHDDECLKPRLRMREAIPPRLHGVVFN
jgi:hypothetical protein